MIELINLSKEYDGQTAVDNISIKIPNGQIYGLIGSENAGKSTLLRLLAGCTFPTSGTVKINGFDIYARTVHLKKSIGYQSQECMLYPNMTVQELLFFIAEARGVNFQHIRSHVTDIENWLELGALSTHLIKHLSPEELKLVNIAQAFIGNPNVILLDNPFENLTPESTINVIEFINRFRSIATIIIAARTQEETHQLCNYVFQLEDGKISGELELTNIDASVEDVDTPDAESPDNNGGVLA